jgi:hypothetical protein
MSLFQAIKRPPFPFEEGRFFAGIIRLLQKKAKVMLGAQALAYVVGS